jgi:hypothetical protein
LLWFGDRHHRISGSITAKSCSRSSFATMDAHRYQEISGSRKCCLRIQGYSRLLVGTTWCVSSGHISRRWGMLACSRLKKSARLRADGPTRHLNR